MSPATNTAKTIARWVALGALFLIPLAPLIVANQFFFPFITGKAFFFRILVEVAVCAWAVLALLDREYRPRFSWVGAVVLAFIAWMFVADFFAINVAKAFFSNFERMEGWILFIHLFGFFLAAGAVLRVEKQWRNWFFVSLGVSVIMVLYSFFQLGGVFAIHQGSNRIDATMGNSAYLAIYFLFNTFIALWLAFTPPSAGQAEKRAWLKWGLIALAVLEGVLIFMTETRGTIIGLTGGLLLAALLAALTGSKRTRNLALGACVLFLIVAGGFYAVRNSPVVQNNDVLNRITSINVADGQTRFTLWHMAWEGVLARPVTGYGQEGFNYVFNKYYDPSLYAQESWFDRAHNAFIDWLVAGGFPAFLLYVSLFAIAILTLWKNSELSRAERILLTAAFVGYACHNLFVFDNLYSYVYFFALLALIDSQVARPFDVLEKYPEIEPSSGLTYALPIAAAVAVGLIWSVNIPGMAVASELISAISPAQNGPAGNLAIFQDVLQHPAFAEQEIREQLVSFAGGVSQSQSVSDQVKQSFTSFAVSEMSKQVAWHPLDTREHLELAFAYRAAGDEQSALREVQAAEALSPQKEDLILQAAGIELDLGEAKAAQADFNRAYELGPQFTDLATDAAAGDYAAGDTAAGDALLLKTFATTTLDNQMLALAYYQTKDWSRLIRLWQLRASAPDASEQTLFGLAAAYYVAGDKADAITAVQNVVKKYPDAAQDAAAALAQIRAGK